jgi:hypothetical protein
MFVIPPVGEAVAVYLKDHDPRLERACAVNRRSGIWMQDRLPFERPFVLSKASAESASTPELDVLLYLHLHNHLATPS